MSKRDPFETLGQLLTEANMQVTFTGWKAELEQAEAKIKILEKRIKELEHELEKAYNGSF